MKPGRCVRAPTYRPADASIRITYNNRSENTYLQPTDLVCTRTERSKEGTNQIRKSRVQTSQRRYSFFHLAWLAGTKHSLTLAMATNHHSTMHPRALLLLSSILLTCLVAVQNAPLASAAATSCAPRTCGNLTIAYPFWIADTNQTSNSSSSPTATPPCGPAAFQVNCSGGRASLAKSFRGGYKILRISYAARTLVVANDNLQTDDTGCPVPRIDVSASLSLAPFTASPANAQLVFLFNCTAAPPGFVNVTCPGARAVVRHDPVYNASAARAAAGSSCEDPVVVPVVGSPGAGGGDYPRLLRGGYLLEWRASPGNCSACMASGGQCGYDAEADAFACVCADGTSTPAGCGT